MLMDVIIDKLIRSSRRSVCITVTPDAQVFVRAPYTLSVREIQYTVNAKRDWIDAKKAHAMNRNAAMPAPQFYDGEELLYLGNSLTLRFDAREHAVRLSNTVLLLPPCEPARAHALIMNWYKARAREVFFERVSVYSHKVGVDVPNIRLSGAKARWGSCSSRGNINLNWRLVMLPLPLIDYVAVHELCHIGCMNHSAAFYARLSRVLPDYAETRKSLYDAQPILSRW